MIPLASSATAIAFSPDGRQLLRTDPAGDKTISHLLPALLTTDAVPPKVTPLEGLVSPDGWLTARMDGDTVHLLARSRFTVDYDPWAEAAARRRAVAYKVHAENALAAEIRSDWIALAFHSERLAQLVPWDSLVRTDAIRAWSLAGHPHRAALHIGAAVLDPLAFPGRHVENSKPRQLMFLADSKFLSAESAIRGDRIKHYKDAIAYLSKALELDPENQVIQARMASAFVACGHFHESISQHIAAHEDWKWAVKFAPAIDKPRYRLRELVYQLMYARLDKKTLDEVEKIVEQKSTSGSSCYDAARIFTKQREWHNDPNSKSKYDGESREFLALRAMEMLKLAQQRGFFNGAAAITTLKKASSFESMRGRDDLKAFVNSLELKK